LPRTPAIDLRQTQLSRLLGTDIPANRVDEIFRLLRFDADRKTQGWSVKVPSYRFDLHIEHDLIEEVARIFGYEQIPEKTDVVELPLAVVPETRIDTQLLADTLVARDYQEVVTYSFVDPRIDTLVTGRTSTLLLANPISSEMAVMRGSLWSGMLAAAAVNLARQQVRVRLFEIGKTFHGDAIRPVEVQRIAGLVTGALFPEQWGVPAIPVDFLDIKSDVLSLLGLTGLAQEFCFAPVTHCALQPGQSAEIWRSGVCVGLLGKLHPAVAKSLEIRKDVFLFELDSEVAFSAPLPSATEVSRYPSIRRDIAVIVSEDVAAANLQNAIASAVPELIRQVIIFDVYRGPGIEAGLKSVALGLILQETSRTLTDHDADSAMHLAVRKLQQEFGAELRD
jgi:phenylalanyl-tRNA synthetase beta chain